MNNPTELRIGPRRILVIPRESWIAFAAGLTFGADLGIVYALIRFV